MRITIRRKGKRAVMKITAESKLEQELLAGAIRKGLGIKADNKEGDEGK